MSAFLPSGGNEHPNKMDQRGLQCMSNDVTFAMIKTVSHLVIMCTAVVTSEWDFYRFISGCHVEKILSRL